MLLSDRVFGFRIWERGLVSGLGRVGVGPFCSHLELEPEP